MQDAQDSPFSPRRLTRDQTRAVDQYAIDQLGLPGLILMENAGLNAAGAIMDLLKDRFILDEDSARVAIVCGGGNNGGDGYVIARHLLAWGLSPTLYATKPVAELDGDAATNAHVWQKLGQTIVDLSDPAQLPAAADEWRRCHAVVDAVLGTGFSDDKAPMREPAASVVAAIGQLVAEADDPEAGAEDSDRFHGVIVAIDVPSGLDCDSGRPAGATSRKCDAVRADLTITFVAEKAGYTEPEAAAYLGRVVVADIGIPDTVIDAALQS